MTLDYRILVLGGTGALGRQIVRQALDKGYKITCLVRDLEEKANFLSSWGATVLYGDLSKLRTLPSSFKNINIVIDASSSRLRDKYTSDVVHLKAKIALVEIAKIAKVKKIIFFSVFDPFGTVGIAFLEFQYALEKYLECCNKLNYTIFRCSGFFQALIFQFAVPILQEEIIDLFPMSLPLAYLSTQDAAQIVLKSLTLRQSIGHKVYFLFGNRFWMPENLADLCYSVCCQLNKYPSNVEKKINYIPFKYVAIAEKLFRFFTFTWNLADRLEFSRLHLIDKKTSMFYQWLNDRLHRKDCTLSSLSSLIPPWQASNLRFYYYLAEYILSF